MIQFREVALENFRSFRTKQVARLAPITLLMGENSSGKTSFMAMVRALWDTVYDHRLPDFKEEPSDLGSFDTIAHHRSGPDGRSDWFRAELKDDRYLEAQVTFRQELTYPVPARTRLARGDVWIDYTRPTEQVGQTLRVGTSRGEWVLQIPQSDRYARFYTAGSARPWPGGISAMMLAGELQVHRDYFKPRAGSPIFSPQDAAAILQLCHVDTLARNRRPVAFAPVRSKPLRTYDPAGTAADPEGNFAPMYLANLLRQEPSKWEQLKDRLNAFGKDAGVFDDVRVKTLGKQMGRPFEVQIKMFGSELKDPPRNMIDAGYGISQVLPILVELMRSDSTGILMMQHPEANLHPRAQAALGSLFCEVASSRRQLIIETHSDYIMDRIRTDIRDATSKLQPEDVSILFFENNGADSQIHSVRVDKMGNIWNTPDGYRQFFMDEVSRALGF